MTSIVDSLLQVVGKERLLSAAVVAERPTSFWNSAPMQAKAVVYPQTTDEVAEILRRCNAHGQSVITHGGLTNCVAAVESTGDDVVVSLARMNRIVEIDAIGGTAVVEAGAVLQTVQETVVEQGLYFPLDLGARGSCTIGGNVATNAGGINVLRYGMMRNLVLGLEAVLADGTVVSSMNRMLKNNAGYDIKQLFIGTEGTLGIVTQVVLRLFPRPASRQSALVAMQSFEQVTAFLAYLQQELGGALCAYEIMWGDYFAAVTGANGHRAPVPRDYPFYVVLQAEGSEPDAAAERFESVLVKALEDGVIIDAVVPKSEAEVRAIWAIREDFEDVLEPEPAYLYDVSLPIREMAAYVAKVRANVKALWPAGDCYALGHVADGNLHFFVRPNQEGSLHSQSDACVYEPLAEVGGSVSAEHGIGTEKIRWLPHSRSAAEIGLMRVLKQSLDPKNLLNPGRVLA
ncbi:MAG: FAD-binding oxidoreductase [Gammaproteobacteria bacterium]|nr:FAD-binding oxidoreductase [Gammaproteobacteria bacterium]